MKLIIICIIQLILVPALSPFFVGIVRKVKARLQNRRGASVFQPYSNIWKLLHKDEVISEDASWIFRFTPYLLFSITIIVGASIPLFVTTFTNHFTGDFLVIVYLLALGTFFLALAGLDVGSAFGGFGSSREMTVAALTEAGLVFSILVLALTAHTTNLFAIASFIESLTLHSHAQYIPIFLAFIGFIIALLAETGRFPFDNPSTHLELTMIHEAMILEYSGKRLALIEWASANKFLIFISLGANLFLPWGIANTLDSVDIFISLVLFILKVICFCVAIAVLESSIAKVRYFKIPDLLLTSFILSVIAIILVI